MKSDISETVHINVKPIINILSLILGITFILITFSVSASKFIIIMTAVAFINILLRNLFISKI